MKVRRGRQTKEKHVLLITITITATGSNNKTTKDWEDVRSQLSISTHVRLPPYHIHGFTPCM